MIEPVIDQINSDFYRIKVPLPEISLKYINSYVIKNDNRSLIIDTGLNRRECQEAMQAGLKKIGVTLEKTDFFITHLHTDHIGLVKRLRTHKNKIYLSNIEIFLKSFLR